MTGFYSLNQDLCSVFSAFFNEQITFTNIDLELKIEAKWNEDLMVQLFGMSDGRITDVRLNNSYKKSYLVYVIGQSFIGSLERIDTIAHVNVSQLATLI